MSTEEQKYQQLVKTLEGIRDERKLYANTASRIGSALLELIHYAADSGRYDDIYLSKVRNDTAKGEITFEDGFVLGAAAFKKAVLSGASEADYKDDSIISAKAVLDLLTKFLSELADKYLRKDIDDEAKGLITFLKGLKAEGIATFLAGMAVEGLATFKDAMSSPGFWSGWSGQGWKLWFDDTINVLGEIVPKASLELDDLTVRGTFRVFEFVINQLRGENDNYVFSGMQKVDHVDVDANTIYLDTNKGETYCPFRSGDILRCQRFQGGGTVIKRYDILVKEAQVGNISDGENRIDYIVWENFDGDINGIAKGDVLCRIDNDRDPERKGIITTKSIGNGAPYIDVIYGLVTNPEESLKARLGRLDGIVNELFGELSGYGLFSNNAFLTGEFFLSTGEAVATKIKMLENLFSSSMSKTTYDIKEDDNIVTNCAFIDDMRGWNVVDGDDMDLFFIDDTPVFMNDDMFSDGHSVASMENVQGKDMLHLLNSGVSQDNALFVGRVPEDSEVEEYVRDSAGNIVKNEDGTLKTEMKTIRPTIYISYRYMCKESGVLNIGFNNGRTTQYSSDMGAIVSVDELGTLTENVNANEGVWIERQYKGYYDKSGDFVISTTGEVYIDVLAVTSKPLNDFKNVVSTALVQTARAIGLYGKNIRANEESIHGVGQSVTELGVVVDANKREVDLFVNTTYANDKAGLETKIENGIKVSTEGIEAVASRTTAREEDTATLKINYDRISTEVENSKGDISSVSQIANEVKTEVTNARGDYASLFLALDGIKSTVTDVDGRLTSIEQTVDGIDLSVYAKTEDVNDKTGEITTSLKGMGINIDTEKITISGTGNFIVDTTNFKLDENGNVDITGKISATSGDIGGFIITDTTIQTTATSSDHRPIIGLSAPSGLLLAQNAEITGKITATSGTFDNCTINETCTITKIEATTGTIGSWKIDKKNLKTEADASLEVEVNGKRFLRINSSSDGKVLLVVRNDEGTAASFNAYGDGSIALALNGQAGDGSYALQSYGDVILNARAGEHINITGLTLSVKNISTTYTLTSNVDVVTFSNTTNITVTMPNARDNKGKVIFMKRVAGSGTITLSGLFYNPGNYDTTTNPSWVNDTKSMIFVSDGVGWIGFYCG